MKYVKTFEQFVNENLNESEINKTANAWYYEYVKIAPLQNVSTIKADKDATKAATALLDFWEKGKPLEKSGFTCSDESLLDLSKMKRDHRQKENETVEFTLTDTKSDKDYKVVAEFRLYAISTPLPNFYVKVSRVG